MTEHIYALVDRKTHQVRYVGRTRLSLAARLLAHMDTARRGREGALFDWLRCSKRAPIVVLLQSVIVETALVGGKYENTASAAEVKWIKRFERSQLTNKWIDRNCQAYRRLVNDTR